MAIWKDAFLATETALALQDGDPTRSYVYGLANGNILVVGTDETDTYDSGAGQDYIARIFDAGGNPLGEPFQLVMPTDEESAPLYNIWTLSNGGFILSNGRSTLDSSTDHLQFNADGSPRTEALNIENGSYGDIEIAELANGNLVLLRTEGTWSNPFADDVQIKPRADIYSPDGELLFSDLRAGPIGPASTNNNLKISALQNGGFVVVASGNPNASVDRVKISIFDESGEQTVNTFNVRSARSGEAEIATLSTGRFIVAYLVPSPDASVLMTLQFRIYNEDGSAWSSIITPSPAIGTPVSYGIFSTSDEFELVALAEGRFAIRTATGLDTSIVTVFNGSGGVIETIAGLGFDGKFGGTLGATADGRLLIKEVTPDGIATVAIHDYRAQGTVVEGTPEADQLTAAALGGTVNGRFGNDTIWGATANDTLNGNNGLDELFGGKGNDILDGGNGVDSVQGNQGSDIVFDKDGVNGDVLDGGTGIDTLDLRGTAIGIASITIDLVQERMSSSSIGPFDTIISFENVEGSDRNETAIESTATNTIRLNGGADRLVVTDATIDGDVFDGGFGTDTFDLSQLPLRTSGQIRVDLGAGTWTRNGASETVLNFENIEGSGYDEILVGSNADNTIRGNNGGDIIRGGLGIDTLYGGNDDDSFDYSINDIVIGERADGGAGNDTLQLSGLGNYRFDLVTIVSIETVSFYDFGSGARTARFDAAQFGTGISLKATIDGNEGATDRDVLDIRMNGLTSLDLSSLSFVQWTSGHDLVQVLGGALSETVVGTAVFDTIDGGSGNDIITGRGGRDTLRGGSGGDTFLFKAGDAAAGEVIDGGLDRDAIVIGRGGVHDFRVANVLSIEQVTFGNGTPATEAAFAIAQFGSTGIGLEAQVMGGIGGGQDILSLHLGGETRADLSGLGFVNWGTGDSVRIFGSSKDDTIIGSEVSDVIDGGLGSDTMAGGLGDETYIVDDAGDEVLEALNEGTDTVLTTLSSLTLSDNVEHLTFTGAGAFDGIGNRRANTIIGGSDADTLQGLLGSDTLCGEAGNDRLTGGNGSDILIGGADRDRLTGEAGFDVFMFEAASDSVAGQRDIIVDFLQGTDLVDVSAVASFAFIGDAAFEGNGASQIRFVQRAVNDLTVIEGDVDGDGITDFQVALAGLFTIQGTDLIL